MSPRRGSELVAAGNVHTKEAGSARARARRTFVQLAVQLQRWPRQACSPRVGVASSRAMNELPRFVVQDGPKEVEVIDRRHGCVVAKLFVGRRGEPASRAMERAQHHCARLNAEAELASSGAKSLPS